MDVTYRIKSIHYLHHGVQYEVLYLPGSCGGRFEPTDSAEMRRIPDTSPDITTPAEDAASRAMRAPSPVEDPPGYRPGSVGW